MPGRLDESLDDEPVVIPFNQLKKNKFALTTSLKEENVKAKSDARRRNHFRDPRFDPRVNGVCVLSDWKVLSEEREETLKKLKRDLKKVKSSESREKIMKAIKILKQRQATEKDIEIKRRVKLNLQKEQMEKLKAGQRASFLTRSELREKVRQERLKSLSQREKEKYLSRQSRKKYESNAFDD
ncbi:unnamed protein product [Rodentolepis nana]|uniref:rRNA biogenesis protein RRP36 n=1 Tax=Rodentolepis nana TaxID=102285 RepID=A0A0R3T3F7_RODNA|nr:unnamed protein product [Rodentolepis nana]